MLYLQYNPSENGIFNAVTSDLEPLVSAPTQQIALQDGTNISGMILDLSQNPSVLVSIFPHTPTDEQ